MKWIELGEIDYKIIIPLIYPFLYQIRRIIHEEDDKVLFSFFTNFLGYLFSGVIYLIIKFRMKRINSTVIEERKTIKTNLELESERSESNISDYTPRQIQINTIGENQVNLKKQKTIKKRIKDQYLFILLLILIYLTPMFLDSYIALDSSLNFGTSSSVSLFFYIFFYIFLSIIILGERLYTHQILSSIVIVISIFIITILFLIKDELSNKIFINIIMIIVVTCLFALYNVLEKKYYNIYMDSPYHLMFVIGAYALTLIIIYEIITVIFFGFDCKFNGVFYQFEKNCQKYKGIYFLLFIADVLSAFIWIGGIQLTVYFFTPCHFIISESISQIISTFINNTIKGFPIYEKIIVYLFFIIIIISTFIYNEVIIINVFSLNKNTKRYINLRQLNDTENLLKLKTIDSNFDDDNLNKDEQRDSVHSG